MALEVVVCPLLIVRDEPRIEVHLELDETAVELFPKRDLIELLQDGLVKPLADAVGLRTLHLRLRVIDVVDRQEELVRVLIVPAAELSPPIGEDAQHLRALDLEERQDPVIEQVRRGNRRLGRIQLRRGPLRVGIHEGLLIDPAHALSVPT